jgi:hypothetical protein
VSFFAFTKSENRRAEQILWPGWGVVPVGEGRGCGEWMYEGEYGLNTPYTLCKQKKETC